MAETVTRAIRRDGDGQTIVFDPSWAPQVTPQWFEPAFWQAQSRLRARSGGRGSVGYIDSPAGPLVLRHFQRGGALGGLRGDRYLWLGAARSRGFREFALLQRLHARGLPVPRPLAARCVGHGPWARADLLTAELPGAQTLAEHIAAGAAVARDWPAIGAMLGRFHAAGVDHADLNAHNILLAHEGWHLIDFDRGRLRASGSGWRRRNLTRLARSLRKVAPGFVADARFDAECWQPLLVAYADALRQADSGPETG